MKKTLALVLGITLIYVAVGAVPSAVHAMACVGSPPEIGVIESVSNYGSSFTAQNVLALQDTFDSSGTVLDAATMSAFVKEYIDNNYTVASAYPPGNLYVDVDSGKPFAPRGDELLALKTLQLQRGDIFIRGQTSSCGGTPFFWLFDKNGAAKSFVAPSITGRSEGNYEKIADGAQTLSLNPEAEVDCVNASATSSGEIGDVYETTNTCTNPMTFMTGSQSITLQPGETKNFTSGAFTRISLLKSTQVDIVKAVPSVFNHYPITSVELLYTVSFAENAPMNPPCCKTMADPSGTPHVTGVNPTQIATPPFTCPAFSRSLMFGVSGDDVIALQNFLIGQGMLAAGNNTGYFGKLTQTAVKAFQKTQGLEAVGIVGPKTRVAIGHCKSPANSGLNTGQTIGLLPPLMAVSTGSDTIRLEGSLPWSLGSKQIFWGDGSAEGIPVLCGWDQPRDCPLPSIPVSQSHIYKSAGTYHVKIVDVVSGTTLVSQDVVVPETAAIDAYAPAAALPSPTALSASPLQGQAPLSVAFTLSDIGLSAGDVIDFGDGSTGTLTASSGDCGPAASCASPTYSASHTYTSAGRYTAKVLHSQYAYVQQDCYPWENCTEPPKVTTTLANVDVVVNSTMTAQ